MKFIAATEKTKEKPFKEKGWMCSVKTALGAMLFFSMKKKEGIKD